MNRKQVKLASVVDLNASAPPVFTGTKEYVSTGALDCDHIDPSQVELVSFEDRPSRANLYPSPGDILFAKMAATIKTILVDSETAGKIYSTGFFALHPKDSLISGRLLYHFLFSDSFHRQKDKLSTGATMKGLTNGGFAQITMLLPERAEHDNLADRLDTIRALIRNREKQLVALDTLAKSLFVEMFGDPVENPKGWRIARLGEFVLFQTSGSRGWAKYYSEDGEIFITIKNVKNTRINLSEVQHVQPPKGAETERTRVREGDLLISITADLGRTGVVTKEVADAGAYVNQHLVCIRLNQTDIDPVYVAHYLESPAGEAQFRQKNQNAVKAGLNFNSIQSLTIALPPIGAQREFRSRIQHIDKSKFAILRSLVLLGSKAAPRTIMPPSLGAIRRHGELTK